MFSMIKVYVEKSVSSPAMTKSFDRYCINYYIIYTVYIQFLRLSLKTQFEICVSRQGQIICSIIV